MSRALSSGLAAEVVKSRLQPVAFFEGLFDSGALRLWTGFQTITWNGVDWTGAGNMIGVSELAESQELKAVGASITLTAPASIISIALAEDYQGRRCNIFVGAMDDNGRLIADPYQVFGGIADVMEINEDSEAATIKLSVESRLIDLERPREHRYEHEDQQTAYPGDLGLQYVASIQDAPILWTSG